jgi:two-component system sensor histidine kinase BaeS
MTHTIATLLRRGPPAALRSLGIKLTLAFALSGVIGAILVALLVGQRTRSEFDRFLTTRDQAALADALSRYYVRRGGWQGVETMLISTPPYDLSGRNVVIADSAGRVVRAGRGYSPGDQLAAEALKSGARVSSDGAVVGYLVVGGPGEPPPVVARRLPPETLFLQQVTGAAAASAAIAALLALAGGVLLARTLTRPLRELTDASRAMARGALGRQVRVRSGDEVGQLAVAFNQMSADLARASQLRTQMTADLAHDLRTPLTILRGYTEGLQDGRLQGAPALYAVMHGEVEHLQRLVEDLRVLSLADAGELSLNRRAVDPAALLERAGLAYVMQAEQQGVALRVEAGAGLPSLAVDTDRMAQVLNNLVSNALRYTPPGGEIALRGYVEDRRPPTADGGSQTAVSPLAAVGGQPSAVAGQQTVVLEVCDTGSGIAPEDLPNVFNRFYRADAARQRTNGGGSGLGLAIAKAIVEAHGGAIGADSAPGEGTTFTIALPAK